MPMSQAYVEKLKIPQMVQQNTDNHETAFTVSIDHVTTSTGISAAERSVTALACVSEDSRPEDFRRPGHMFPLLAKRNGVLERDGHAEATVYLRRLAGLKECGLCCEIMREDGTMMRTPELSGLAKRWGIKFITIRNLQAYRKFHERLVDQVAEVNLPTKYGEFTAYGFVSRLDNAEMLTPKEVGKRIKERRNEIGISMPELGRRVGVNKSTIQRYETDGVNPNRSMIINGLAEALQTTPEWLTGLSEEKEVKDEDGRTICEGEVLDHLNSFLDAVSRTVQPEVQRRFLTSTLCLLIDLFSITAQHYGRTLNEIDRLAGDETLKKSIQQYTILYGAKERYLSQGQN